MSKIINIILDTPEKYWLVVNGYHVKKSFWGVLMVALSFVFAVADVSSKLFLTFFIIGIFLIILSIIGHIHKGSKPYFKIWEKYK